MVLPADQRHRTAGRGSRLLLLAALVLVCCSEPVPESSFPSEPLLVGDRASLCQAVSTLELAPVVTGLVDLAKAGEDGLAERVLGCLDGPRRADAVEAVLAQCLPMYADEAMGDETRASLTSVLLRLIPAASPPLQDSVRSTIAEWLSRGLDRLSSTDAIWSHLSARISLPHIALLGSHATRLLLLTIRYGIGTRSFGLREQLAALQGDWDDRLERQAFDVIRKRHAMTLKEAADEGYAVGLGPDLDLLVRTFQPAILRPYLIELSKERLLDEPTRRLAGALATRLGQAAGSAGRER